MSTFWKLLGVANVGLNAAQAHKLNQLEGTVSEQVAQQKALAEFIASIRAEIFRLRQMAKSIVEIAEDQPRIAAGALAMLADQIDRLGIQPEFFPDLNDKEYAAETIRAVRQGYGRYAAQLPPHDQQAIRELVHQTRDLPDYTYYLSYYEDVHEYRQLEQDLQHKYRGSTGITGGLRGILIWLVVLMGALSTATYFCIAAQGQPQALLGGLLFAGGTIAAGYMGRRYSMRGKAAGAARARMEEIAAEVDLEQYSELVKRLGADRSEVQALYDEATRQIHAFFGPYSFLVGVEGQNVPVAAMGSFTSAGAAHAAAPPKQPPPAANAGPSQQPSQARAGASQLDSFFGN